MNHLIQIWMAKFGVKCIDCGWKFHAFCVIPLNDNLLDFEEETLDHLELQGFFTCGMEK